MLIPYEVDIPFERTPWVNWLLAASLVVMFGFQMFVVTQTPGIGHHGLDSFQSLVLREFNLTQMIGHMWLHAHIGHLIGNVIFLWVFGNAVCQKIGNLAYFPIYLLFGLASSVVSLLFTPGIAERGSIGASGAINGIVGMYLILYPRNEISVYYIYWYGRVNGTFDIEGFWMILIWLAYDFVGAFLGLGNTNYFAHLGGFLLGAAVAIVLLLIRRIVMNPDYEESLLDVIRSAFGPEPILQPAEKVAGGDEDVLAPYRLLKPRETEPSLPGKNPARLPQTPSGDSQKDRELQQLADQEPLQLQSDSQPPMRFVRYACSCGMRFKSPVALAGRAGICPRCKKHVTIPNGPVTPD
jgi:membrane associated rhomboid family serine protease